MLLPRACLPEGGQHMGHAQDKCTGHKVLWALIMCLASCQQQRRLALAPRTAVTGGTAQIPLLIEAMIEFGTMSGLGW